MYEYYDISISFNILLKNKHFKLFINYEVTKKNESIKNE